MSISNRVLAIVVCCGLAGPALALEETICAPTTDMAERLAVTHGVARSAVGLQDPEQVIEVWTSPGGERWAIVAAYASGLSCIMAMGEAWFDLTPDPADPA